MRFLGRAVAAIAILGLAGIGWLFARGVIEIALGEWRGGVPHGNTASTLVLAAFSAIYAGMVFFTVRHLDRQLRD